jgi:hypothetical protein
MYDNIKKKSIHTNMIFIKYKNACDLIYFVLIPSSLLELNLNIEVERYVLYIYLFIHTKI